MHAPVLTSAPANMPVTLAEAKAHVRVNVEDEEGALLENEDDALITALIAAATAHLDGWTGVLGRCLVEQTWRQDFDAFAACLPLPLGPVLSIESVTYTEAADATATVDASNYVLQTNSGGRSVVRFVDAFDAPADLAETAAVRVTFKAGYPAVGGNSTVPQTIKQAILLLVGHWYETREAVNVGNIVTAVPMAVDALIAPYRRLHP